MPYTYEIFNLLVHETTSYKTTAVSGLNNKGLEKHLFSKFELAQAYLGQKGTKWCNYSVEVPKGDKVVYLFHGSAEESGEVSH